MVSTRPDGTCRPRLRAHRIGGENFAIGEGHGPDRQTRTGPGYRFVLVMIAGAVQYRSVGERSLRGRIRNRRIIQQGDRRR
jgi:hypothetical protein